LDEVDHSRNRACHAVTEMNFGLHFTSSEGLAQHGG